MENHETTFARMLYNSIVADIRKARPDFKSSEYWGYRHELGSQPTYEVQGPHGFYWHGAAFSMWEAKFNAFCKLADDWGIETDNDEDVLYANIN